MQESRVARQHPANPPRYTLPMPATPELDSLHALLTAHRIVLGLLMALCIFIALQPAVGPGVPPGFLTATALVLALGRIFTRALTSSPALNVTARSWLAALGLLCGLAVGLTGLAATLLVGARNAGLGFALGGLILSLRAPSLKTPPRRQR